MNFTNYTSAYPTARRPTMARERRLDLAAARRAGGPADAARRRQRGGRRARRRDHAHGGRADLERHRQRIAFAIVWDGKELHGLNASGRSPAAWTPEYFTGRRRCRCAAGTACRCPAACRPGSSSRSASASCPFAKLFEPAIDYADNGYLVSPFVAERWDAAGAGARRASRASPRPSCPAAVRRTRASDSRCPRRRATLELIAETSGEAFYEGELAEQDRSALGRVRRRDDARRPRRAHATTGSARSARTTAATRCTRSRRTARASSA